ncbi:DUF7192 family protein [Collimonas humicola]|uniref:DUF7192 family protein n=1 Tax=Collimonas humicola TaxID=2825886 RepID=UPI001B8C2C87|nr:hypothetical protein [Collimonas humicola]
MYTHPELNIQSFDSVAELGNYCQQKDISFANRDGRGQGIKASWYGDIGAADAYRMCREGDTSQVAAAEAMMAKFEEQLYSAGYVDMPSVAGCYPCVPEALMGEPESMREPTLVESENAPLTILVDVSCSASVSAKKMQQRGIAVLSVVMALSASRPVTLKLLNVQEGKPREATDDLFTIIAVNVNTTPLDLASAAYAITHVGFARHLMYGACWAIGGQRNGGNFGEFRGIRSGRGYTEGFPENKEQYRMRICGYLGIDGEALVIPPAISTSDLILSDPAAWVHEQIAKYGKQDAE